MIPSPIRPQGFLAGPIVLVMIAGLLLGGVAGCNTEVQSTIWKGLNDVTVSLVNVLFQTFNPTTTTPTDTTTPTTST